MTSARSFVRLAFAGFFVSSLIVACTVKEGTSEPNATCNPGDKKDCTCSGSGKPGQRECNDSGDGYGACVCEGNVDTGGSGNGNGGGDGGAGPVSTGGTTYAGSTNGGSISYAGEAAGGAGASAVEVGGAGGAGDVTPLECQNPGDDCETCYFGGCCDQYAPCVNDPDGKCLDELADVLACTDAIKAMPQDVKTSDLEACAQRAGQTTGTWSSSLSPLTVDVINCIAGEPGWEGSPWGPLACKASCFDK
jgi:hypothetical protein